MRRPITRRELLAGTATTLGLSGYSTRDLAQERNGFSPDRNGFGFQNWSSENQYFDASSVRAGLFPLVVVLVDTDDVNLTVETPAGAELTRASAEYMDVTRGEVARVRSRYGAEAGTYRLAVFGNEPTDYEMDVLVADPDGPIVREARSGTLELGDGHEYELEVPSEGDGSIARSGGDLGRSAVLAGGGTVGGFAAGAVAYRALRGDSGRDPSGN